MNIILLILQAAYNSPNYLPHHAASVNNLVSPLQCILKAAQQGLLPEKTFIISDLDNTAVSFDTKTLRDIWKTGKQWLPGAIAKIPHNVWQHGKTVKNWHIWHLGMMHEVTKEKEPGLAQLYHQLFVHIPIWYYTDVPAASQYNFCEDSSLGSPQERMNQKPLRAGFPQTPVSKDYVPFGEGGSILTPDGVALTNLQSKDKNFLALCDKLVELKLQPRLQNVEEKVCEKDRTQLIKIFIDEHVPQNLKMYMHALLNSQRLYNVIYLEDIRRHVDGSMEVFSHQEAPQKYGLFVLHVTRDK